ncbi:MAG: hypothetical protein Q8O99_04620 [bacterium]|nr:hypothetical protein [bacterium]
MEGVVQDAKNVMQQLTYSWYYEPFVAQYQYGVDGNRYVIDGHKLVEISS